MKKNKPVFSNWLEIPVSDFERAKTFYNSIFDIDIQVNDFGNFKMGVFPHATSGCAICKGEQYNPGPNGPIPYLVVDPDLTNVLNKIEKAGGKVLQNKKQISSEHGFMALFNDTEGNKLALWSNK